MPINGSSISCSPTGAIDLVFSGANKSFLLSDIINWNEGDSYTIHFREPVSTSDIHIGEDAIPKGITSFQGFNPPSKHINWMASNGEKREESFAWLKIISASHAKLKISEVIINRKDGSQSRCYYPNPLSNSQYASKQIHWEAKNGEEYEEYLGASAQIDKAEFFSGKVAFKNSDSYIGGADWGSSIGGRLQYRLKLHSPTASDNFAWKSVIKSGETRYQKIDKNSTMSTLSVDESVKELYIVHESDNIEELDIQEISVSDGSQPKYETLVLWHANGKTTEISLSKKPCVTFSADKILIKGAGINFEYPSNAIVKFTYKTEDVVNDIDAPYNEFNFFRDEEHIVFNGIKSTDEIALYKLNGSRIPVQLTYSDENKVTLSLSSIPFGIYILKVNGKTTKIVKQ